MHDGELSRFVSPSKPAGHSVATPSMQYEPNGQETALPELQLNPSGQVRNDVRVLGSEWLSDGFNVRLVYVSTGPEMERGVA